MVWRIEFDSHVVAQLTRLDRSVAARVISYLEEIAVLDDPRSRGRGLTGNLSGLWRYRVGDYRVICELIEDALVIYALEVIHRSVAYRRS